MREFAYKKAFEMRKAKPWKKIDNGRMFAVRLKSGEIRFCFYVSVPRDGINSFFMLSETKGFQAVYKFYCRNYQDNSFLDYVEYTNNQDAIIINFDNKSSLAPSEKEVHQYAEMLSAEKALLSSLFFSFGSL